MRHRDAKEACKSMDQQDLNGIVIDVQIISEKESRKLLDLEEEGLDEDKAYVHSAQARTMLMQHMSKDEQEL